MAIFIVVYVAIALVNYSLVQSLAASAASSYLSELSGGTVKVGSIGCNPFNHVRLRNIELISPENDTICVAHTISVRFKKFPFDKHGLSFSSVRLKDVRYHLRTDSTGINLLFLINALKSDKPKEPKTTKPEFKILVDNLRLDNVTYSQDLEKGKTKTITKTKTKTKNNWGGVDVQHMEWRNVNATFRNVRVDASGGPHITCRIEKFSTTEKSGLHLHQLRGNAYVTNGGISITNWLLETDDTHIEGDVLLDFTSLKSMKHFLDSVVFTVHFNEGSYGGLRDAAYWTPALTGMDEKVELCGDFSGPISNMYAENFHIAFGDESKIDLNAHLRGLPNIKNTTIEGDIQRLHTTYADLSSVKHPQGVTMKAESLVKALDFVDAEIHFDGTLNDFKATLQGTTQPGDIQAEVLLKGLMEMKSATTPLTYRGMISSSSFAIGEIAPNEWVTRGGMDLEFEGRGTTLATMNTTASGNIHHVVFRGQRLLGELAMDLKVADSNAVMDLSIDDALADVAVHAEMLQRGERRTYSANVEALHVDLARFGLWKDTADKRVMVDALLDGRYSTSGEGNGLARVTVNDIRLNTSRYKYNTSKMVIGLRERNNWKDLTVTSDICDAQIRGYYKLEKLPMILSKFMDDFMPDNLGTESRQKRENNNYDDIADAEFEINMDWHDATNLIPTFLPKLTMASGTSVQANYNFAESIKTLIRSDSLGWGSIKLYNVGANGEDIGEQYRLRVKSDEVMLGNVMLSENADLRIEMSHLGAQCRMYWENSSQTVGGGDVNLRLVADSNVTRMVVDNSLLALGGVEWRLRSNGDLWLSGDKYLIQDLQLVSDSQSINLKASRLGSNDDEILLTLNTLGLSLVNTILQSKNMTINGVLDGSVKIGGLDDMKYMNAKLNVDGLVFDDINIGTGVINSEWSEETKLLNVDVDATPLSASGYIGLGDEEKDLALNIATHDLPLKILQPFVTSFSSDIAGNVSSELLVGGTLSAPIVEGFVAINDGHLMVDFLNVTYSFSDTIRVDTSLVSLENFEVKDDGGGAAMIDGILEFKEKDGLTLDLALESKKLLCMNTNANKQAASQSAFLGTIVAAANGTVKGTLKDLYITLNAKTLEGSSLSIPINGKKNVKDVEYITFVSDEWNKEDENENQNENQNENKNENKNEIVQQTANNYHLEINISASPNMEMIIPLTTSVMDADISARGAGDLQLKLSNDNPFTLIGDYELASGTVGLRLLGVRKWDFTIEKGSAINFPGNIIDARFNVNAIHTCSHVSMSSLTGSLSSNDMQKQINVENVITFSGTAKEPSISFDIRLPNADQSIQEEVFAYIDRTNERDMLNQTVSLLMLGRFYNSSIANNSANTSVADEGYGFVANSLGALVSNMVSIVDVNFDYKAGNELTTEQIAVDISKEWNKLYFETTLGFGGEARVVSSDNSSNNMTGDMLVGYKINPRLHLFVFNRSNNNDYTRSDLPYKQGVGIKYTRDFDNWKELFRRRKKK